MGLFNLVNFKDIHYISSPSGTFGVIKANVKLSKFGGRFRKAQEYLDTQIMKDMEPYVAYRTGALLNHIKMYNQLMAGKGEIMPFALSYGKNTYQGLNSHGAPIQHWTNPQTQPYWFDYTRQMHEKEWVDGCKDIILGKDKK